MSAENGIELGAENGSWSGQLALTNGAAGGAETNTGKRISAAGLYLDPLWRVGSGLSYNDGDGDERLLFALYSGAKLKGAELLFEVDWIRDSNMISADRDQIASLVEINTRVKSGSNLKISYEYLDPDLDVDEDERTRLSLVYEVTPLPQLQLRVGTRQSEGIPQNTGQNADEYFVRVHAWY